MNYKDVYLKLNLNLHSQVINNQQKNHNKPKIKYWINKLKKKFLIKLNFTKLWHTEINIEASTTALSPESAK